MDGLNHSVIIGKCPSCLIYEERVAAMAAALNQRGYHPPKLCSSDNPPCYYCEPALSDTGKGWLPPEVREQAVGLQAVVQMWDDHDNLPYREFDAKYPWLCAARAEGGYDREERLMFAFTRATLVALEVK